MNRFGGHTRHRTSNAAFAVVLLLSVLAAGCGAKKDKASSQVAAKVNSEEISVHQIDYALRLTAGVTTETADAAGRQILERLISQELAVQKAKELKLDRTLITVQALDAARRDVLARAYIDSLGESVAKPSQEEVAAFYGEKPALFKDRKVYTFQEVNIVGTPPQLAELQSKLGGSRSVQEFADDLRASGLQHSAKLVTQPAENLPLELLSRFAGMSVGQAMFFPQTGGTKALLLASVKAEPVDQATAAPAIEKFLLNDRRRVKVEAEMKALRAAAKVELVGKFSQPAASAAGNAAPAVGSAASAVDNAASAGGLSADTVRKGLSGAR